MAGRSLSPEENAIWEKVAATVRRISGRPAVKAPLPQPRAERVEPGVIARRAAATAVPLPPVNAKAPAAHDTLDGGWDRRLRKGAVIPDRTIDLHGHSLASAHQQLDHALERAVSDHVRVLLVVTGKPPRDPKPHQRGLIRAAIGDWLGSSRHAGQIAAVRNAHPRHGGAGALYVILRRART